MKKLTFESTVEVYSSTDQLPSLDKILLFKAKEAIENAYAPYSKFNVGAALRLANGEIFLGNNQENAAYPLCLCAERVALFYAASKYPDIPVEAMAISAKSLNKKITVPVSPCGSCRQTIFESEFRNQTPIRLILQGETGEIYCMDSVKDILPLTFSADFLK